MSLFDDISKKIATAGQGTVKMAKDLAGITRLNGQITEEQRAISAFYTQMGEKYYQMYKDAPGEAFAQDCSRVRAGLARIADIQLEIQKLKNVRTCPKCGSECSFDAVFCGVCGQQLTTIRQDAQTADFAPQTSQMFGQQGQYVQPGQQPQQFAQPGQQPQQQGQQPPPPKPGQFMPQYATSQPQQQYAPPTEAQSVTPVFAEPVSADSALAGQQENEETAPGSNINV